MRVYLLGWVAGSANAWFPRCTQQLLPKRYLIARRRPHPSKPAIIPYSKTRLSPGIQMPGYHAAPSSNWQPASPSMAARRSSSSSQVLGFVVNTDEESERASLGQNGMTLNLPGSYLSTCSPRMLGEWTIEGVPDSTATGQHTRPSGGSLPLLPFLRLHSYVKLAGAILSSAPVHAR